MDGCLGFLGPAGTFTEDAAIYYMQDEPGLQLKEYPTIDSVIEAVSAGKLQKGVVPLENSLEGSVSITLDMLVEKENVFIYRELIRPVSHCLMALPGKKMQEIREVHSHPQALSQCRRFLKANFCGASIVPRDSTAAAASLTSRHKNRAAIAHRRAAELFDLEILAADIQDSKENVTRFIVLAACDHPKTGADKTSLIISISDGPGSLYNVLGVLARSGINLTRIESRPVRRNLGEYYFFIDFEGHRQEPRIISALEKLNAQVLFYKMLGSYPSSSGS